MTRTRKGFCMVAVCLVGVLLAGGIWWEYEGQININTSDAQTIYLLPGIDMEMAQNIVAFREVNGPLSNHEELLKVKGMNADILEGVLPYVKFEGETQLIYKQ